MPDPTETGNIQFQPFQPAPAPAPGPQTPLNPAELQRVIAETAEKNASAALYRQRAEALEIETRAMRRKEFEQDHSADAARRYTFVGAVDLNSATTCIVNVEQWVREDPEKPITVIFNTPGGGIADGLALYDTLEAAAAQGVPVHTHATGNSLSMGAVLLQAGTRRTMSPNAYVMIHQPSVGTAQVATSFELSDQSKLLERMGERLVEIITAKSKLTPEEVHEKWDRRDWWLDANDALEAGLVDSVELV